MLICEMKKVDRRGEMVIEEKQVGRTVIVERGRKIKCSQSAMTMLIVSVKMDLS